MIFYISDTINIAIPDVKKNVMPCTLGVRGAYIIIVITL